MQAGVLRFCGKVRWDIRSEVLENELLPICRRVAEEKGVPVIDVHSAFVGRKELFADDNDLTMIHTRHIMQLN